MISNTLKFVRECYHIPSSKRLKWCLVKETSLGRSEIRVGVWVVGTDKYIDLGRRRFFSGLNFPHISREIVVAKRKNYKKEICFSAANGWVKKVSKTYMFDIYSTSIYSDELLKHLLC